MKKFLVGIALLGFGFGAHADHHYEVQINGGFAGTSGGITINDSDNGDNNPWSIGGEVYKLIGERFQIGGLLNVSDADTTGSDTNFAIGVLARYNLDTELRDSMFFGGGFSFKDAGDDDLVALHLNFGKRYALSDSITYTPNIGLQVNLSGDRMLNGVTQDQEGTVLMINLISFSGFL